METLIAGLVLFLGIHSVRVFADGARTRFIEQRGPMAWKGLYTVISLVGFVLIVQGYGQARLQPLVLWTPPLGMRHAASLLTLLSFISLAAAYVPRNAIKARVGHPMTLAVKIWALGHLLANGNLADVLLFGGFLVWSALVYRAARQRDRVNPAPATQPTLPATLACVLGGAVAWAVFAFWAHGLLIGVRPFG